MSSVRSGAAAIAVAALGLLPVTAGALPAPTSPEDPAVASQWVNPAVRPGEGTRASITLVDAPSALNAGEMFHVKLRIHNDTDAPLANLRVVPRRGPATGSVLDQRAAAVASVSEYGPVGRGVDVDKELGAGESAEVELDVELPGAGTYPLLFELKQSLTTLDTERFHISVRGEPSEDPAPAMTALYPITAPIDIVPGETGEAPERSPLLLKSETLANQLAPGGRLERLLSQYEDAVEEPGVGFATCVGLDPALVDTVARMAEGYRVTTTRPPVAEEPKRLRDSWTTDDTTAQGEIGKGQADAQAWLAQLRSVAAKGCTVALPWQNVDVNTLARTGDQWLMREALERGPFVLERELGTAGTLNAVIPGAGYITPDAAPAFGWANHIDSAIPEHGLQGEWEAARAERASTSGDGQAALDRNELPDPADVFPAAPAHPVHVLAARSSVDHPGPGNAAWVAPGVMAVQFQDSLASVLATVGSAPATVGYSNDALRYRYEMDSQRARAINAASALRLAVQEATPEEPVFVNPPAGWDADSAALLLGTVAEMVRSGEVAPMSFGDFLNTPDPAEVPTATRVGTLFPDPTVVSDAEVLTASQQAEFTDDLTQLLANDPQVALTRYGFTLPLRRDVLAALSMQERQSLSRYDAAVRTTAERLRGSRDVLQALRASVTLIPPGNVYTRTSPSSPLLIVAQNGMPLPVQTTIRFQAASGPITLHVPTTMRIPARGSQTVQMTADYPEDQRSIDLQLYLAGTDGSPISQPVNISVRTAGAAVEGWALVTGLGVLVVLMLMYSVGRRRRARAAPRSPTTQQRLDNEHPPLIGD